MSYNPSCRYTKQFPGIPIMALRLTWLLVDTAESRPSVMGGGGCLRGPGVRDTHGGLGLVTGHTHVPDERNPVFTGRRSESHYPALGCGTWTDGALTLAPPPPQPPPAHTTTPETPPASPPHPTSHLTIHFFEVKVLR